MLKCKACDHPIRLMSAIMLLWLCTSDSGAGQERETFIPQMKPQWPGFAYDRGRTGRSPYKGPHTNKLKWQFDLPGWGSCVAVGADGTAYVGTLAGCVFALNRDGAQKWRFRMLPVEVEPPADWPEAEKDELRQQGLSVNICDVCIGLDGTIYFGESLHIWEHSTTSGYSAPDYERKLYALDPDGSVKWKFAVGQADIATHISIGTDGSIYFGTVEGKYRHAECRLRAVNPDGTEKWDRLLSPSGTILSPALAPEGTIYVGADKLRALNPEDGSAKWEYDIQTTTSIAAAPAVGPNGTIYVCTTPWARQSHHKLFAINPNGTKKWDLTVGAMETSPAIGADGTIYITSWVTDDVPVHHAIKTGLTAITPQGHVKWSYETRFPNWHPEPEQRSKPWGSDSSPIVGADGIIYFGTDAGLVYAVNPDGTLKWTFGAGGEFDNCPSIDAEGTLYICHSGGPGEIYGGSLRCYAISDKGTLTVAPVKPDDRNARITRLKAALERARRDGNEPEVREIRGLLEDLRGVQEGYGAEQDEREISVAERIESLGSELKRAEAEGNELEVNEITQLLEELQAQVQQKVTAVQAIAIATADERVQQLLGDFEYLHAEVEFAEQWQVWLVNFHIGDRHVGLASLSKDGKVLEVGRDEESDETEQEQGVPSDSIRDGPKRKLSRSSGEYLGQKWYVDQDHLMWWDGKPYVPFGGFGVEPGNEFGLNTFNFWIDFDPFTANADYTREQHRVDIAQKLDAITKAGGTCIVQFSMALPHIPGGPQPGMRWWQPEGGIDGSRLAYPEVRRKILKVWEYYAPAVRKRCVRAVMLWNEINVWHWPEHTSVGQYGQILGEYARQVKRIVGDLPVCFKIAGTWRAAPVIAGAAVADGLGLDVWFTSPDDAHARRDVERALRMLNARQKKTAWFFIAEGGRGIAEGGSDEPKEPDNYWDNWPPFRSKQEALGILRAYAQAGAKGFIYNGPTSEAASRYHGSYRWLGELQPQIVDLMLAAQ